MLDPETRKLLEDCRRLIDFLANTLGDEPSEKLTARIDAKLAEGDTDPSMNPKDHVAPCWWAGGVTAIGNTQGPPPCTCPEQPHQEPLA